MSFLRMTDLDLRGKRVLIREDEPAAPRVALNGSARQRAHGQDGRAERRTREGCSPGPTHLPSLIQP